MFSLCFEYWMFEGGQIQGFLIPNRIGTVCEMYILIPAPFNGAFSRRPATSNKLGNVTLND
jgi:hypothetical protein